MGFGASRQVFLWLVIFVVVGSVLVGIQFFRANQPKTGGPVADQRIYTSAGPLPLSSIDIEPSGFHLQKIDLNRRAKLSGSFRTSDLRLFVTILVLREADLENWKNGVEVKPVVKTNSVPRGKISPVLDPGVYYLVIDNRDSERRQTVSTDFTIE